MGGIFSSTVDQEAAATTDCVKRDENAGYGVDVDDDSDDWDEGDDDDGVAAVNEEAPPPPPPAASENLRIGPWFDASVRLSPSKPSPSTQQPVARAVVIVGHELSVSAHVCQQWVLARHRRRPYAATKLVGDMDERLDALDAAAPANVPCERVVEPSESESESDDGDDDQSDATVSVPASGATFVPAATVAPAKRMLVIVDGDSVAMRRPRTAAQLALLARDRTVDIVVVASDCAGLDAVAPLCAAVRTVFVCERLQTAAIRTLLRHFGRKLALRADESGEGAIHWRDVQRVMTRGELRRAISACVVSEHGVATCVIALDRATETVHHWEVPAN